MGSRSVHPAIKIVGELGGAFAAVNQLIQTIGPDNGPTQIVLHGLKKNLENIQTIAHKLNNKSFI